MFFGAANVSSRPLDVTLIVPTRNEAANIAAFLSSIPDDVPLIIVDGSQDATRELVPATRLANTLVLDCPGSLTRARQLGAQHATTRWLVFTDADVVFAADYFEHLRSLLDSTDAAPETARELGLIYGPKLSDGEYARYYRGVALAQRLADVVRIPAASGSNMIVSARAFAAVGGFDTGLTCNEDSELGWRIARARFGWRFDSELIVWAADHRRLRRGRLRKTLHTVVRCVALFYGLLPPRWRAADWGYWSEPSA